MKPFVKLPQLVVYITFQRKRVWRSCHHRLPVSSQSSAEQKARPETTLTLTLPPLWLRSTVWHPACNWECGQACSCHSLPDPAKSGTFLSLPFPTSFIMSSLKCSVLFVPLIQEVSLSDFELQLLLDSGFTSAIVFLALDNYANVLRKVYIQIWV